MLNKRYIFRHFFKSKKLIVWQIPTLLLLNPFEILNINNTIEVPFNNTIHKVPYIQYNTIHTIEVSFLDLQNPR
jgi:hypothetical protein